MATAERQNPHLQNCRKSIGRGAACVQESERRSQSFRISEPREIQKFVLIMIQLLRVDSLRILL